MNGGGHTAVEIFSGGGGLAVGLREAGFNTVAAVEVEPHAAATFKANHPSVQVFRQDVRTVTGAMLVPLTGEKVDALAACPPCQGFSSLTSKWRKEDERNSLVSEVGRLADELRPRAIMMENVPGLAKKGRQLFDALLEQLETLGYETNWSVLQVADYGVPQRRRRLVMLAGLGFSIAMPEATHSKTGDDGKPTWRTVRDTIAGNGGTRYFTGSEKAGRRTGVGLACRSTTFSSKRRTLETLSTGRELGRFSGGSARSLSSQRLQGLFECIRQNGLGRTVGNDHGRLHDS